MNKSIAFSILATVACITTVGPAQAAFIVIPQPNSIYTSGTTLLPITQPACTNLGTPADPCPAASLVGSLAAGPFTVSISSPDAGTQVIARAAVPVGWATWNTPPAVESSTPRVIQDEVNLTCATCTLNFAFSTPIQTFGFEAEPDPFPSGHSITAAFLNGASTVGTISIAFPSGASTARLFAATTDQQFTNVRVTVDGTDFAMAQFRAGATFIAGAGVPEPGTVFLMLGGLAALGFCKLRRS